MVIVNEHDNHDRQRLDSSLVYISAHNVYYVKSCLSDAKCFSGVGVSLMRNGKILATGENVSLGTVNKSKVPLGLSATYGQTSVIGVTFIYE